MFALFKKKPHKKKKLVIILSAGRCGSTYLIDQLNRIKGVNIYGENHNLFPKIIQTIHAINKTISQAQKCNKVGQIFEKILYKKQPFIKVEWYNDIPRLDKIRVSLEESIRLYFDDDYEISGFKEIRFFDRNNIQALQYFEKYYPVYYIHLTRDIEEQSRSGFWLDSRDAKNKIIKINENIAETLSKKERYLQVDISEISDDIGLVRKFLEI